MLDRKKLGVEFSPSRIKFLYTSGKNQIIDSSDCEMADELDASEVVRKYMSKVRPKASIIKASVKSEQTVTRFWSPPPMSKRSLDKAVRFNISNIFPIDMSGYTVDYRLLRLPPDALVMVAAMPVSLSRNIADIFRRNGMTVNGIDIYQNCITKYFAAVNERDAALFYRVSDRIYFILMKQAIPEAIREFTYLDAESAAREVDNYLHINGVDFKKAFFIQEKDEPLFPAGLKFPGEVNVRRMSDGYESLKGLLM